MLKQTIGLVLFILIGFFSSGCINTSLKLPDYNLKNTKSAPSNFKISAGYSTLNAGGFKVLGQVNSQQLTQLSGSGYKIVGEIVK